MEELADTPKGQLIAIFDALEEWFATPESHGYMFIKVPLEFQDAKYRSTLHQLIINAGSNNIFPL
ncbi:MAG: hypothetical protein GY761_06630 [Hyphomicrobiales bacterium]|nr:hypothetical protein [Hyphomicrobiales bacterium]